MAESRRDTPSPPPQGDDVARPGDEVPTKLTLLELTDAFTTYGADLDLACGTLRQCAEELRVLLQAKQAGCAHALIDSVLLGIAQRMEVAAKLASEESAW